MEARVPAEELLERVRKLPDVERAEIAGSLRRRKETVADVDIVGSVKNPASAEQVLAEVRKNPSSFAFRGCSGRYSTVTVSPTWCDGGKLPTDEKSSCGAPCAS